MLTAFILLSRAGALLRAGRPYLLSAAFLAVFVAGLAAVGVASLI